MVLRLKENLLIDILSPHNITLKYSKSLLNLKTLMIIEKKDNFVFPDEIYNLYKEIIKVEDNFLNGIPLRIVEKYYFMKSDKLNSYINIEYGEYQINKRVSEIYILLEEYYSKLYLIGSLIGNYYNIEIKVNTDSNNDFI